MNISPAAGAPGSAPDETSSGAGRANRDRQQRAALDASGAAGTAQASSRIPIGASQAPLASIASASGGVASTAAGTTSGASAAGGAGSGGASSSASSGADTLAAMGASIISSVTGGSGSGQNSSPSAMDLLEQTIKRLEQQLAQAEKQLSRAATDEERAAALQIIETLVGALLEAISALDQMMTKTSGSGSVGANVNTFA
ncbi:hypothetical protein GIY62_32015 [Burkholderia plantarii]|uniref:hypothetical protein n=1 Tax=Burkholderia plantarii TaxID=41899 RepID=UPI00272D447C|nr:hypothetical protein [Burkholderia plantarii]WLE62034.1 hypothetical protein GIY62_32015 [Burkholderia plantarii]